METVEGKRKYMKSKKQGNPLDKENKNQTCDKRVIDTDSNNTNERCKLDSINHEKFKEKDNYYRNGQLWSMSCKHIHSPRRLKDIDLIEIYNSKRAQAKQKSGIKRPFTENEYGNENKYNCELNETIHKKNSHRELHTHRETENVRHKFDDTKYGSVSNTRVNSFVITDKGDSLLKSKYIKSFNHVSSLADLNRGLTGSHPNYLVYYVNSSNYNKPISQQNPSKTTYNKKCTMENDQKIYMRPKSSGQYVQNKPNKTADRSHDNNLHSQKLINNRFYNNPPKDIYGSVDKNQKVIVKEKSINRPIVNKIERAENSSDKCQKINITSRFRDRSQIYEKDSFKNIRPISNRVCSVKRYDGQKDYSSNHQEKIFTNEISTVNPFNDGGKLWQTQLNPIVEEQSSSDDNYEERYHPRCLPVLSKFTSSQKIGGLSISNVSHDSQGGHKQAELNRNRTNRSSHCGFVPESHSFDGDDQKVLSSKRLLFVRQNSPKIINKPRNLDKSRKMLHSSPNKHYYSTGSQQRIRTNSPIRNSVLRSPFFDKKDRDICKPSISLKDNVRKLAGISAPGIIQSSASNECKSNENRFVDRSTSYCQTTPKPVKNCLCDNFSQTQQNVNSVETCTEQDLQGTDSCVPLQALKNCMQKLTKCTTDTIHRSLGVCTNGSTNFLPLPPVSKFVDDADNQSTKTRVSTRNLSQFSECHDFTKEEEEEKYCTKSTITDNTNQTVDLTPFLAELLNSCLNNTRLYEEDKLNLKGPCNVRERKTSFQPTKKQQTQLHSTKKQYCNQTSEEGNSCENCKTLIEQLMQVVKSQKQCNCQQIKTSLSCNKVTPSHCNKGVNSVNKTYVCSDRTKSQCGSLDDQSTLPRKLAATQTSMQDENIFPVNSSMNAPDIPRKVSSLESRSVSRAGQRDECGNKIDRKFGSIVREITNVFGESNWREGVARKAVDCCLPQIVKMGDFCSPHSISTIRSSGQDIHMPDGGQKLFRPIYSEGDQFDITCNPVLTTVNRNQFHCYSCGNSISQESLALDVDEETPNKRELSLKCSVNQKYDQEYDSDSNSLSDSSEDIFRYSSPDYSEGYVCSSVGCTCTSTVSSPSD